MISLEKANEAFEKYVTTFDMDNSKIIMKYDHSMRVRNRCVELAGSLKLSKEKVLVAGLIGLLHDIGKFEQIKRFNCCDEYKTLDSSNFGSDVLFKENMIRTFVLDRKYDKFIEKALKAQEKINVLDNYSEEEKIFAYILKDANKLDIFYRLSRCECKLYNELITDTVINEVNNRKIFDLKLVKTSLDLKIFHLCYVYDLHYPISYVILKKEKFIDKAIDGLQLKDKNVKQVMETIKNKINKYVEEKIGGN